MTTSKLFRHVNKVAIMNKTTGVVIIISVVEDIDMVEAYQSCPHFKGFV